MPTNLPPAVPLPRRVRWFAVWNWLPVKQWVLAGLLAIGPLYVLSIGPAMILIEWRALRADTAEVVYRPLMSVADEFTRATGFDPLGSYMRACSDDGTRWFTVERIILALSSGGSLYPFFSDAQVDPTSDSGAIPFPPTSLASRHRRQGSGELPQDVVPTGRPVEPGKSGTRAKDDQPHL